MVWYPCFFSILEALIDKKEEMNDFHVKFYDLITKTLGIYQLDTKILTIQTFKKVHSLAQGDCFGELALMSNRPRAARIVCSKDSIFGILLKNEYKNTIG